MIGTRWITLAARLAHGAWRKLDKRGRWHIEAVIGALAALGVAHLLLSRRDAWLLTIGVGLGAAAATWPAWRRRQAARVKGDPALRLAARLEGLVSGSFKLGPGLVALMVTFIAVDLAVDGRMIKSAIAASPAVGPWRPSGSSSACATAPSGRPGRERRSSRASAWPAGCSWWRSRGT